MKFTRYHTKSGSQYDVRPNPGGGVLVRQSKAGGAHYEGHGVRAGGGVWRAAVSADCPHNLLGMTIYWGPGRDEFSPDDGQPDEGRQRYTNTSPVVRVEECEE